MPRIGNLARLPCQACAGNLPRVTQAECIADYLESAGRMGAVIIRPGEVAYLTREYRRAAGAPRVDWNPVPTESLIPPEAASASVAADVECLEKGTALHYVAPWAPSPGLWCRVLRVPLASGLIVATFDPVSTLSLIPQARERIAERCGEFASHALTDAQVYTYLRASSIQQSEGSATRAGILHAGAMSLRTVSRHLEILERLGVSARSRSASRVELEHPIGRLECLDWRG